MRAGDRERSFAIGATAIYVRPAKQEAASELRIAPGTSVDECSCAIPITQLCQCPCIQ